GKTTIIRKLCAEGLPVTLAVSLHAPDDATRAIALISDIMANAVLEGRGLASEGAENAEGASEDVEEESEEIAEVAEAVEAEMAATEQ
ncbi:MAG: hypothetical protein EOM66_11015, partial [Clostridia bacterium]|nr:hypothetical protein [Clostridia bacterium]